VAQGSETVARGYTVQFTTAVKLFGAMLKAHQQGTLEMRLEHCGKPKLLFIDELV
jgi:DNA replication protein DnaC